MLMLSFFVKCHFVPQPSVDHFFLSLPFAGPPRMESNVRFGLYTLTGLADRGLPSKDPGEAGTSKPRPTGLRLRMLLAGLPLLLD